MTNKTMFLVVMTTTELILADIIFLARVKNIRVNSSQNFINLEISVNIKFIYIIFIKE